MIPNYRDHLINHHNILSNRIHLKPKMNKMKNENVYKAYNVSSSLVLILYLFIVSYKEKRRRKKRNYLFFIFLLIAVVVCFFFRGEQQ